MKTAPRSVPRRRRIVGPERLRRRSEAPGQQRVGYDSTAGPSEMMVMCEGMPSGRTIAREVIAHAEHDLLVDCGGRSHGAMYAASADLPDVSGVAC